MRAIRKNSVSVFELEYCPRALRNNLPYELKSPKMHQLLCSAAVAFLIGLAAVVTPGLATSPDQVQVSATPTPKERALDRHYLAAKPDDAVWLRSSDGLARVRALVSALSGSARHGLTPGKYDPARFEALTERNWKAPTEADEVMALDRALSATFLSYARDMIAGAVDPADLEARVHLNPRRVDPAMLLDSAIRATDMEAFLAGLAPSESRYAALQEAGERLLAQRRQGGWGAVINATMLSPGDLSSDVLALRRRLIAMGDLAPEPEISFDDESGATQSALSHYDDRLAAAVSAFQRRHGLAEDGVAGPATLRALNRPIEARLAQVILNLERLRWHRGHLSGRRIEVNAADFKMVVYNDDGTQLHQARVIVGQQERRLQTPEFSDHMSYLVLNPTWTVPKSIIRSEILPELQRNPGWLTTNNMILLRGGKSVDPLKVDWSEVTPEQAGAYSVVQKPGPGNALGNVKFMFPNSYNIYLHDTPTKHLFDRESRAFSHGCVRVERPFALAWTLLADQTDDPGALIDELLATGKEQPLSLDRPIPIRLMYFTSWVDEAGVLHFRDDIYGRDKALARALHAAAAPPPTPVTVSDL